MTPAGWPIFRVLQIVVAYRLEIIAVFVLFGAGAVLAAYSD